VYFYCKLCQILPQNSNNNKKSERAVPFPGLGFENFNWVKAQLNLVWLSIEFGYPSLNFILCLRSLGIGLRLKI